MAKRDILDIDPGRKLLLAALAVFTIMAPLVTGGLKSVPAAQLVESIAQTLSPVEQTRQAVEPARTQAAYAAAPVQSIKRQHKPAPAIPPARTVLVPPVIDVSTPIIIVPVPQLDSPPEQQSAASDTDAPVCRPPQQLPGMRLSGPQVCLPQREWDRIKRQGLVLMPDGRTLVANYEKEHSLSPYNCMRSPPGATSALGTWGVSCFR